MKLLFPGAYQPMGNLLKQLLYREYFLLAHLFWRNNQEETEQMG
jgi:hypothetical protein